MAPRRGLAAIKDLAPPRLIEDRGYGRSYDATHLLPAGSQDLKMVVWLSKQQPHTFKVELRHGTTRIGYLTGGAETKRVGIDVAQLDEQWRGRGLGMAMYEALYALAYHELNIRRVGGYDHTVAAEKTHQRLRKKHGLKTIVRSEATESDDSTVADAYSGYEYQLDGLKPKPKAKRKRLPRRRPVGPPTALQIAADIVSDKSGKKLRNAALLGAGLGLAYLFRRHIAAQEASEAPRDVTPPRDSQQFALPAPVAASATQSRTAVREQPEDATLVEPGFNDGFSGGGGGSSGGGGGSGDY